MRELNEVEAATVTGGVGRVKSGGEAVATTPVTPTTDTAPSLASGGDKVGAGG